MRTEEIDKNKRKLTKNTKSEMSTTTKKKSRKKKRKEKPKTN